MQHADIVHHVADFFAEGFFELLRAKRGDQSRGTEQADDQRGFITAEIGQQQGDIEAARQVRVRRQVPHQFAGLAQRAVGGNRAAMEFFEIGRQRVAMGDLVMLTCAFHFAGSR